MGIGQEELDFHYYCRWSPLGACLTIKKDSQKYKIQRIVPINPMSHDGAKYERFMKILYLYRISLGQARQEEFIEYFFENGFDEMGELFMN